MENDTREQLHKRGLNKWVRNNFKGTLLYGTGSGKTWCGIKAMNYFLEKNPQAKFLVLIPRKILATNTWIKEITNAKSKKLIPHIKFVCYQSVSKEIQNKYDLVILDEVHHITSLKRIRFLIFNKSERFLGLTASLTIIQKIKLKSLIPVIDEYTINEANEDELVSDFEIYTVPVELTLDEKLKYKSLSSSSESYYQKKGNQNWKKISERARLLYDCEAKKEIAPKIVNLFPDEYGVIFTLSINNSIEVSENIENCIPIHSKLTRKQIDLAIKSFSDGRTKTRLLATPTMLDEGITLPRLSYGILLSSYSKERQNIQRIGRHVRKDGDPNKLSIIVRVYCKYTIEEKWVEKGFQSFKVNRLNSFEELEEIINQKRNGITN